MSVEHGINRLEQVREFLGDQLREMFATPMRLARLVGEETNPVAGKFIAGFYLGLPIAAGVGYLVVSPGDPWVIAAGAGEAVELMAVRALTSPTAS